MWTDSSKRTSEGRVNPNHVAPLTHLTFLLCNLGKQTVESLRRLVTKPGEKSKIRRRGRGFLGSDLGFLQVWISHGKTFPNSLLILGSLMSRGS